MIEERDFWIAWAGCPEIGPIRFDHLVKLFGSAEKAWKADEQELVKVNVKGKWLREVLKYREKFDWGKLMRQFDDWRMTTVTRLDNNYPARLREIEKAPMVLYVMETESNRPEYMKGGATQRVAPTMDTQPMLAVVGTRRMTSYGRQVTRQLVQGLVDAGLGIVSGLMYGVDEIAHRACVEAEGFTVGVWAGGLDTLFKGSRQALAELILANGGMLVSEFPLGLQPSAQTFPYRNRIVAGMSCGVLVTEGSEGSGTLITAGYAAEQGKEVFAVPGPITSMQSAAPSKLIKAGAKLVTNVGDILEELKLSNYELGIMNNGHKEKLVNLDRGSKEEKKILELLKNEELSLDELARKLKMPVSKVSSCFGMMELKGWVKQTEGKWGISK